MRLIHRFIFLRYGISTDFVLNRGPAPPREATSLPVAADMLRIVNALKAEAYEATGGRVDYARLRASAAYAEYGLCARRLPTFDPATLTTREERLAFWINLYFDNVRLDRCSTCEKCVSVVRVTE